MRTRWAKASSPVIIAIGAACWLAAVVDWRSPIRAMLALSFLLFGPGLVIAELLGIHELPLRVTVAFSASLAIDTLVALSLVYAGHFSAGVALALILVITAAAAGAARFATRREPGLRPESAGEAHEG